MTRLHLNKILLNLSHSKSSALEVLFPIIRNLNYRVVDIIYNKIYSPKKYYIFNLLSLLALSSSDWHTLHQWGMFSETKRRLHHVPSADYRIQILTPWPTYIIIIYSTYLHCCQLVTVIIWLCTNEVFSLKLTESSIMGHQLIIGSHLWQEWVTLYNYSIFNLPSSLSLSSSDSALIRYVLRNWLKAPSCAISWS